MILFAFRNFIAPNSSYVVGQKIDSLNAVYVYYNGSVSHTQGRNISGDGYNIGLKYQCVEFVKRYYYQYLNHKMPNTYGNAKDYFDHSISDGKMNTERKLYQFCNPSHFKPKINDILIFDGHIFNKYGHVAIVSKVLDEEIEFIQQNPGPLTESRETVQILKENGLWKIKHSRLLGWLSLKK